MLSVDVSGSMLARDFKPDRITAAKRGCGQVHRRPLRRPSGTGGVVREARRRKPLTTDQRKYAADDAFAHPPQRHHRGRYGHRQRPGHGDPTACARAMPRAR